MSTKLTIESEGTTCHFFKPKDPADFVRYFNLDGPERPLRYFLANFAEEFCPPEERSEPPGIGDCIVLKDVEFVVRARILMEADKEGMRRPMVVLVSEPEEGVSDIATNAS